MQQQHVNWSKKCDDEWMANPTWPNDEATYFLFVQQIHYERILKLDGDMRIFDDIDQNNVASIASVLNYFFIEIILKV